jgi:primosomal protein N' (replication factor Y) (superfamily II helicase)
MESTQSPSQTELAPLFASVILEVSIQKSLDYLIPEELRSKIERGVCVEIPLRGRSVRGFVTEVKTSSPITKVQPIRRAISDGPVLTEELFSLAIWMSRYYIAPLGKTVKTLLPAGVRKQTKLKEQYYVLRKKTREELREFCEKERIKKPQQVALLDEMLLVTKGILLTELLEKTSAPLSSVKSLVEKGYLDLDIVRQNRSPLMGHEYFRSKPKTLRDEQKEALEKIISSLRGARFETHLLFGVTGSGKTEIYMQAIDYTLSAGKSTIMLVPEIALTEQTIERFRSRFSCEISVLHHRLSDGERKDAWEKIMQGQTPIVIGARSALFSPVPNLGLIIVDEEHEASYKNSDDAPCYQARDVAILRAKQNNATVVLGSATPSLESYYNALQGKYTLSILKNRSGAHLPEVIAVDMRREFEKAKGPTIFSDLLLTKLKERKAKGEQAILLLNRRGYHTLVSCSSCGEPLMCPHCSTKLTFHKKEGFVQCHLCNFTSCPPATCPSCKQEALLQYRGMGTEKVEAMLSAIFPDIRVLRIDADTTRHKGSLEMLLQEFRSGKADVIIGTQMIAKGLHFPEVTLVGVLNADASLNIPDFRSEEHVFQLITQVAGRAGRGELKGEVLVQTLLPEHATIQCAIAQDYLAFYKNEIENRKLFHFPPFCHLIKVLFVGHDETQVVTFANDTLKALCSHLPENVLCHPVIASGHVKVKDLFRYQFLVRTPQVAIVTKALEKVDAKVSLPSTISRFIDVDPSSSFF